MEGEPYGYELLIDMQNADPATFTRDHLETFFSTLCERIDMVYVETHMWDEGREEETRPQVKGISAVCFIETSSITIHALDLLKAVYINIFSCKAFDANVALTVAKEFFDATHINSFFITRGPMDAFR